MTELERAQLLSVAAKLAKAEINEVRKDLIEQINAIVIPEIPKVVHGKDGLSGRGIVDAKLLEGKLVLQYTDGSLVELGNLIGEQGPVGPAGPQGSIGLQGEKGNPGEQGIPGNRGPKGEKGDKGDKGDRGEVGEQGIQGIQGEVGPQGEKGDRGEVGPQGSAGLDGRDGVDGKDGADGKDGRDGVDGKQGEQGPIGLTGPQGPQGVAGPQGERGEKGDKGDKGDSGSDADVTALEKKLNEFTQDVDKRISKVAFNAAVSGGSSAGSGEVLLYRLDDVDYNSVKTPTDGHALVWNDTLGKWQANSVSGGGGLTNTFTTTVATRTLIPTANVTYNLGSSTARYNDIWLANSTIYLGDAQISASGSKVLFNNKPAVSNAHLSATYLTNTAFQSALANTNSYIASESARIDLINTNLTSTNTAIRGLVTTESARIDLINTNLTGTNTAIRTLVSDRMQVANVTSAYVTNSVFQSALSNTNAYIATKLDSSSYTEADVRSKAALANTNAYIASVSSTERSSLANTNAYIAATAATERSSLANTNAYIASVQSDVDANEATERAALANTNSYIATKLASADYTAADVLSKLTGVDGAASGLDADLLDGQQGSYYAVEATEKSRLANTNAYIASVQSDVDTNEATERAALANTNAYIAATAATERSSLANTNSYIASVQSDVDANEATERAALANTNAYIASVSSTERSALANTNAYIATKADIASPTFTGTPAAPTAAAGTNTTQLATTAFVRTEVTNLVDSAPATLDTLNELAAALGDDPNFATTLTTNLGQKLGATASVALTGDVTGSASFSSNAVSISTTDTNLGNTNSYIASVAATERSSLANTNAYIASVQSDVDANEATERAALANTNAYIAATAATERSSLANTNAYIATMLPKSGGQMSGNITMAGAQTVDGRDLSVDGAKLDGIESGATADQTAADIRGLGFFDTSNDGASSGLDADLLDGQHGSYYAVEATEKLRLANTNAYIASVQSDVDANEATERAALANTNAYIATKADIVSPSFTGNFDITSTTAGSAAAPEFELFRNITGADANYIGQIKFSADNDAGGKTVFAKITGKIGDASSGTEDGIIEIAHQKAGSQNINVRMTSTEFKILNGTDFDIETHDGSSTGLRLNNTLVTATATELNYSDGVTSNIQTQLDAKLASSSYTEADVRSKAALANTNAYIASVQSDVDTNEATERAALANTNSYIASVQSDVDANESTERAALANTNAYIASVSSTERSALANTNAYIATMLPKAGGQMSGNITMAGAQTVDGRDLSVDGAKLDGIEAGATADQTAADIRGLGFFDTSNDGAASGLDADLLDGQHGSYYAVAATENSRLANTNSYIASVQSDVDANEATERAALANTNAYIASVSSTERAALANTNSYIASVQSDVDTNEATERAALANTNAYIATKLNSSSYTEADVRSKAALANTNAYIASVQSDVDSNEATERAALANTNSYIASVSSTERAALANTNAYIATMLPKTGGQMSGNITFAGSQTVDGRDVSADGSKLDGIESGATADQTAADIRGLGFFDTSNDGAGSGLDADLLDGQQGSYYAPLASPSFTGTISDAGADHASQTLTDAATIAWNAANGRVATVTLGGNRAVGAPTNLKVGTYILKVIQDGTGSRTLTWNSVFYFTAGVAPTLTTTAGAIDIFSFFCDGTNMYGSFIPDVKTT